MVRVCSLLYAELRGLKAEKSDKGECTMELNDFKDRLFEMLNEGSDELGLTDIEAHDRENIFIVETAEGSRFEIECREV